MASSTQASTRRSSISAQKSDRRRRRSPHLDDDLEIEVPPLKELEIGHSWDSLQQAKDGVKAWILDRGESYRVLSSNKDRLVLECRTKETCRFYVRVSQSKKGANKSSLVSYTPHTCPLATHQHFPERNASWYIARNHALSIARNRRIKARDIMDNEAVWRGNTIPRKQAQRAIQYQLQQQDGLEEESFALFPDYAAELMRVDPGSYTKIKLHDQTSAFQAIFIALGALRNAVPHLRHLFALDGTHTRSKYRMILAVTVGIDANDNVLPICWALIPRENEYWWHWYCNQMALAFPTLHQVQEDTGKWVFVSDREKGLQTGIKEALPRIEHVYCCQHIADNIYARFGKACKALWWPIARAIEPDQHHDTMNRLKETDKKAWEYVNGIDTAVYVAYQVAANRFCRFGHDTSNIVESINGIWGEYRDMPPLMMLDYIHTWMMKKFSERQNTKATSKQLANEPWKKFKERAIEAQKYTVTSAGNGIFQVDTPRRHRRQVDLVNRTCSCLQFNDFQSPCSHAIACCFLTGDDAFTFFHYGYTLQAYRDTYKGTVWPITKIHSLKPDCQVQPPQISKLRGRPRTRRIRKYHWKITVRKCLTCHQIGHNRRTCRNQPIVNGRAQRTQQRYLESDLDSDDDDRDIDTEFADQEEWLQNLQDQPEFQDLTYEQLQRIYYKSTKSSDIRACP